MSLDGISDFNLGELLYTHFSSYGGMSGRGCGQRNSEVWTEVISTVHSKEVSKCEPNTRKPKGSSIAIPS